MANLLRGVSEDWEVVIGLEVHAQVSTNAKLFSGAPTAFGGEPNTQVSIIDAAMPGMLPVLNRTAVREYDLQKVALPFLIRAVGAHFSSTSALTRHLGDLLFIWGNRFALDPARLQAAGLAYQPLINTSSKAWSFAWKGGWLPPEILQSATYLEGEQPLALALRGPFPAVEFQEDAEGRKQLVVQTNAFPPPAGELVLIGCSEMFKNDYLHAAPFQHDQLLLNAVALLAYGPELGGLQARHKSTRGFTFSSTTTRAAWRIFVIATGPLTVLLYGLWRFARRQHPPRIA